uniref:Uncharacterized protein n=1 Tax=Platysiphonia delicata TaxID=2006979 RepID=A0A1Z1M0U8_9FLOR|nr:hypothetical protein [Platysiphonia delicata]ARW59502.1 hypothetical protein [Platysiphonia delicata]
MTKYWPNHQSAELNYHIALLFKITYKKLFQNLSNNTNHYLYTDLLNDKNKKKLLIIILKEFEILILDIIELNIQKKHLTKINYKIFHDFVNKVSKSFIKTIDEYQKEKGILLEYSFQYPIIYNDGNEHLLKYLLFYLVFGSSSIDQKTFNFNKFYTPYKHVQILFENLIVQTSNLSMENICRDFTSIEELFLFLRKYNICHSMYISPRSIALFFNNLYWQNLMHIYINKPKEIYSAIQQVWILSYRGLIIKNIYLARIKICQNLNKMQVFLLMVLEIRDIIVPKIENYVVIIVKYIIYVMLSIFSNITILVIRLISLYNKKIINNK